jgi:gliding motility-associated protein GldE
LDAEPPDLRQLSFIPLGFLLVQPLELSGYILLLLILLIFSGMVSGSEIAFFSLKPGDIENLKNENTKTSKRILKLKEKPRKLLATILISNNFINIAIIILSEAIIWGVFSNELFVAWGQSVHDLMPWDSMSAESWGRAINFLIVTLGATFLLVLFGEVAPKIYASLNNIKFARTMALPLSFLNKIFSSVSTLMVNMSSKIEKKMDNSSSKSVVMEDLNEAINLAVSNDEDSIEEIDILKGILKFTEVPVKQIMRSRVDVIAIDFDEKFFSVLQLIKETGYSRFPVYKEDKDNIAGILHTKDLLGFLEESDSFKWQEHIRNNVLFVPEFKMINDLLKEFQLKRSHMAIVVDEYGGSEGIVTLEDVMEEVIGEIKDEFHDIEDIEYEKIDDSNYIFEGKTMLNDVCRIIGKDTNIFDEIRGDADSIAGLILETTGKIPKVSKEIFFDSIRFTVVKVSNRRIEQIKLTLISNDE